MTKAATKAKAVTIGLDLAKDIFQVHAVDKKGAIVSRNRLRREEVLPFFRHNRKCVVGMEACATSHHWARTLKAKECDARLISAQFVKP
jgi:transposase